MSPLPPDGTAPPPGAASTPPGANDESGGLKPPLPNSEAKASENSRTSNPPKEATEPHPNVRGAWEVHRDQYNFFMSEAERHAPSAAPWEDELFAVLRLPEPAQALDREEIERWTDSLQSSRLLLLRHSPDRQLDGDDSMRGVLHSLRRREPGRHAYTNGFDGTIRLNRMVQGGWREDRRGIVIYLYGSGDPAALGFFNSIERVDMLCRHLAQMDCYLLLTASPATALKCEHELGRHIGLWSFASCQRAGSKEFGQVFTGRFELTLASCAALFPGLPAGEFASLVKLLTAPAPARAPPAVTPSVATAEDRWWRGERDLVLAELGLRLQLPPQASDTGDETADAGIFVADAARRTEVPAWLYEWHPFLLTEQLDALTAYYLAPHASRRFCVGYRRLVQQLDARRISPLSPAWLLRQTQTAMGGELPYDAMQRIEELATSLPEQREGKRLIGDFLAGLAGMVVDEELHVHEQLRERGLPGAAAEEQWALRELGFWRGLQETPAGGAPVGNAAQRHAVLINLILALTLCAPEAVVKTLSEAVNQSDDALMNWLRQPLPSLAHALFGGRLSVLLEQDPTRWVALAVAVGQVHPPLAQTSRPPRNAALVGEAEKQSRATGRWLSLDCLYSLSVLREHLSTAPWPDAIYKVLLGNDAGQRLGQVLASLLYSAERLPDAEPLVDAESALSIYQWLALAAILHKPGDPGHAEEVGSALIGPLHQAFPQAWRMALVDCAVNFLDSESEVRYNAATRDQRDQATRRIKSLQLVVRKLRAPAPVQPSR